MVVKVQWLYWLKKNFKVYCSFKTKKKLCIIPGVMFAYHIHVLCLFATKSAKCIFLISDQQNETERKTAKLFKLRIIVLDWMPLNAAVSSMSINNH